MLAVAHLAEISSDRKSFRNEAGVESHVCWDEQEEQGNEMCKAGKELRLCRDEEAEDNETCMVHDDHIVLGGCGCIHSRF